MLKIIEKNQQQNKPNQNNPYMTESENDYIKYLPFT